MKATGQLISWPIILAQGHDYLLKFASSAAVDINSTDKPKESVRFLVKYKLLFNLKRLYYTRFYIGFGMQRIAEEAE